MLAHLAVHNLGVLANASIDPSPGFTVITGETGAGKTLLLGGLRLILGAKSLSSEVGAASDRTQVDGLIIRDGQEVGVTRVVPRNGNSRAHLDGVIVSAAALDEALGTIVEIVGQHDQLSLRSP
ncbi:MAG: AAA family ATPase, partial [Acidimicrobiia bacterium]